MSADIVFASPEQDFVLVQPQVWSAMHNFVQRGASNPEAGGILIGSYRGNHIEISSCTTPMPLDVRKRMLFDRLDRGHQKAASNAWNSSGRTDTYVGEWHTHPERYPVPSALDRSTWQAIIKRQNNPVVFIIVGTEGVCAFKGSSNKLHGISMMQDISAASD